MMNNFEINHNLLNGNIHLKGVLPHLDQLKGLPFHFNQEFGLNELPTDPGIIMIRGPRQYGKSTWLEQNIYQSIKEFGAGSALYLNCDEISSNEALLNNLRDLINLFPSQAKIKRIFIDEITAIKDWQKALKRLADAGEIKDILIVTTGSKAADLRHGVERLPGRKGKLERTDYIFVPIPYSEFQRKCATTFGQDTLYAYILSGGSAIGANSLAEHGGLAEYVVNTITDWVWGEFSASGRSRANTLAVLDALFKFAPNPIGQAKLARECGFANNTVAKGYVELLADLMLVLPAYPFDINKNISILRKECKFHFTNVFFAICTHPRKPRTIAELKAMPTSNFASILEWLVAQEIWRQSCIANKQLEFLNFWQTKEHEVDFFIPEKKLWFEVKHGHEQAAHFLWFTRQIPKGQVLHVINKEFFDTERIKGISLEDFLQTKLLAS